MARLEGLGPADIEAEGPPRLADAGKDAVIIVIQHILDTGIEGQSVLGEGLPAGVEIGHHIAGAVLGRIGRGVVLIRRLDPAAQDEAALLEVPARIHEEAGRGQRAQRSRA